MQKITSVKLAGWDNLIPRMDDGIKNPKRDKGEYDAQHPDSNNYTPYGDHKTTFTLGPGFGTNRRRGPVGLDADNVDDEKDLSQPELTSHTQKGPVDDNEGDLPITDRTFQTNQKLDWMSEMGEGAILNSRDQNPQTSNVLKSILSKPSVNIPTRYNVDESAKDGYRKLR